VQIQEVEAPAPQTPERTTDKKELESSFDCRGTMPDISTARLPSISGALTIAGHRISFRVCVFLAGSTFWIINTLLQTGHAGLVALRSSVCFLVGMILITSATRTIRLSQMATFYCLGGAMMSVVWLVDYGFTILQPDGNAVSRKLFTPFLEESMKFAPVAVYLWRQRRSRVWSMGASDVLLLAAASGAGFGLVEDAFIQNHFGVWHPVSWLPTTAILGTGLTIGHQSWTALAGVTLGLALLWRPRVPLGYLLGASGFLWSMLDHFRNNFSVGHSGFIVNFLNFITGHGWLSLYLLLFGAIAVVGSDVYAERRMLVSRPQLKLQGAKPPESYGHGEGYKWLWRFLVDRRALAYVLFRCQHASGPTKDKLALLATTLERRLLKRPFKPI
jgi:RsiW-degrading membrane proteinase PrsW (M82 family)